MQLYIVAQVCVENMSNLHINDQNTIDIRNIESIGTFVCNMEIGYYDPNGKKVLFPLGDKQDWTKLIREVMVYVLK